MEMTDKEFEVIDELYFVTSYSNLFSQVDLEEDELKTTLKELIGKNWVRCMKSMSEEIATEEFDFENQFKSYFYLASKVGLLIHNGMS